MIAQGTDGLSRGMMCEDIMAGRDMLDYVDIVHTATSRSQLLISFVCSWMDIGNLMPLLEAEWFDVGHGIMGGARDAHGLWIPTHVPNGWVYWWDPPPVIASVALEEALRARHKRTDATHIFFFTPFVLPLLDPAILQTC